MPLQEVEKENLFIKELRVDKGYCNEKNDAGSYGDRA